MPLAARLGLERGKLVRDELALEGTPKPALELVVLDPRRNPTRPKLIPSTGTPVPRKRLSARSIVPSPPRTTARSTSSASTSSTPASRATRSTLERASATFSGRPWVTTVARSTDGIGNPVVELGRQLGLGLVDKVEERLTVALRAGKPRVRHTDGRRLPVERGLRDLPEHAPPDSRDPERRRP